MSTEVKVRKVADKEEDLERSMEHAVQMRIKAVAAAVKRSLELSDPEVAAWLTTRIAELITVLQHAPSSFSTKVLITILDALPDEVAIGIVRYYMDRIDKAYKTISQLASKIAPKTLGLGGRDPMTSIIYMLAEQYITQQLGGTQQPPPQPPPSPAPIPEELKRVIDQLNAAENTQSSS